MKLKFGDKPFGEVDDMKLKLPPVKRLRPVDNIVELILKGHWHDDDIKRLINAVWYRAQQGTCFACRKIRDKQGGRYVFVCKKCNDKKQVMINAKNK